MLAPIILVKKSSNKKTGPMAVTIANAPGTCPDECAFKKAGCYAQNGPSGIHSNRAKTAANDVGKFVRELPEGGKIRHFVSGDLANADNTVNHDMVREIVEAHKERPDVRGIAYTHMWRRDDLSGEYLNSADSLTYNASCETVQDVELAHAKGYDAVMVVPADTPHVVELPTFTQFVCPATYKENVSCYKCMLCGKKNRTRKGKRVVVAFPVHGAQSAKAAAAVAAKQVTA